jgi:outer membrane protein assembly factor BamB
MYIGCYDHYVYAITLDGKEFWRFKTNGGVWWQPVLWENRLYFTSWDCHLYVLDADSGEELWRFTTSTTVPSYLPPAFEAWETEIKIPVSTEDVKKEKSRYSSPIFGSELFGEYKMKSQYKTKSEYKTESEYK